MDNDDEDEEGWENPFQPEGEVSQDAELILRLWKGGNLKEDLDAAITQLQVTIVVAYTQLQVTITTGPRRRNINT